MRVRKILGMLMIMTLVLIPIVYVQAKKISYANSVTSYLIEKEHYSSEELQSVKGVWGVKLPAFFVEVMFKDEPQVVYIYYAHAGVEQVEHILTPEGLERGVTEDDLKHYVRLEG